MPAKILIRHMVSALHHWPGATGKRSYLASPHMHDFHIEAHASVGHHDRDIEFHDLRDQVKGAVGLLYRVNEQGVLDFGSKSCEAIAQGMLDIIPELDLVRVWEDDSCVPTVEPAEASRRSGARSTESRADR